MDLLFLILVLLLLAALLFAIVLPIVALVISINTRRRIAQLEAAIVGRPIVAEPQSQAGPEPPPPIVPELPPPSPTPPRPAPTLNAFELESMIGRRWVGWVAILLILFATAFFMKYAFENRWIGELGRVAIGVAFGVGMSIVGFRYHQRGWRLFSQILTAGGIILLYLSSYAAFGYYHLVGQKTAFLFLALLVAEAAALALFYNAPAIAIMALVGGFLTPLLLRSDRDQYQWLFAYILTLDIGALALLKHWRGLSSIAYFGTQILFWLWYNENYDQQKRGAVLVFQTAVFVIFLLAHVGRELIRREVTNDEDALLILVNPFVFFATTYYLYNSTHHNWMGVFAIGMALLYAGAATLLLKRATQSRREILLLVAVGLTFVTIAIPIQLNANWITMAWAVEGLAVLWAALEIGSARLRFHAFTLFVLAFFKLMFWDTPYRRRP